MIKHLTAALMIAFSAHAAADDQQAIKHIFSSLKPAMASLNIDDIRPSPVEGIYEVARGMAFFYVTSDARYVFSGDLVDVQSGVSITEQERKTLRLRELERVGGGSFISFPAENEKYVITVFTDIDCGYCRKLHREMAEYNKRGITVRYAFYPRSGPNTPSFQKAEAVWCADDQNEAMTTAKMGGEVSGDNCENPVMAQYEAGQAVGVRGTPAVILPDGSMQPGYLPAERLLSVLKDGGQG
nr:DsbC family protein [Oceanococcus sp. HetDA_MAG_MS8]